MKKVHKTALDVARAKLIAVYMAHPDLKVTFKDGEFIASIGGKTPGERRPRGTHDRQALVAKLEPMVTGDVAAIKVPKSFKTDADPLGSFQRYLAGLSNSVFGAGGASTAMNREKGIVEIMRT